MFAPTTHYNTATVMFDRYNDPVSTKSNEHVREAVTKF